MILTLKKQVALNKGISLVNLGEISKNNCTRVILIQPKTVALAEFCVQFLALFHQQDHLALSNSI